MKFSGPKKTIPVQAVTHGPGERSDQFHASVCALPWR
jgi:hypothetical protein